MLVQRKLKNDVKGHLFISPVILGILIWTLVPMLLSLYYSFTQYDILSPPKFIGLGNYVTLFHDPSFLSAIQVTIIYAVVAVPVGIIAGFFLAVLLNQSVPGIRIFRTIFYLPAIVPVVAGTELWSDMFSPSKFGVVNTILMDLHIISHPFPFFAEPSTALFSLIVMGLWSSGGGMLIWLAGLKSVPTQLYEAASIDGAGGWIRFSRITIPLVTPTIFFNLIMGMIGAMQMFTQSFVLGGVDGNPLGSLDFINVFVYRHAFSYFEMGEASAAAWVLFFFTLILTLILFTTSRGWVFYEGRQN
jgi:multiple sugar transport system permease protein